MRSETLGKHAFVTAILPKVSVDGVAKVGLMQAHGLDAKVLALVKEHRTFPTLAKNLDIAYLTRFEILSRLMYHRYIHSLDLNDTCFIIAHNIPSAVVAFRLRQQYKTPYLIYMHDARFSEIPGTLTRFKPEEIKQSLYSAKSILTNSNKTSNELEELYSIRGSPLYPGCVSSSEINENKDDVILFVHSIARGKNFDILLHLMERNKQLKLIIAGGKRYTWQAVYIKFKSKLGNRVQFVFNPTEDVLVELYRRSKLLIHLGIENFGLSPLEAAGQGTPSVVTKGSGVLEVLRDGSEIVACDEDNIEELDSTLNSFTGTKLREFGEKAWNRAREFSWSEHAKLLRKELVA